MTSVWYCLSVAITKGWELHEMDVNNFLLDRDHEEKVYMSKPPGFTYRWPSQVCELQILLHASR